MRRVLVMLPERGQSFFFKCTKGDIFRDGGPELGDAHLTPAVGDFVQTGFEQAGRDNNCINKCLSKYGLKIDFKRPGSGCTFGIVRL